MLHLGDKSQLVHMWANWLHHPRHLGSPQHFTKGDKIRSGPQVAESATFPCRPRVSNVSQQGTKSQVAKRWAHWLYHRCRLGDRERLKTVDKIRSGR